MADRVASFVLSLGGDDGDLRSIMSAFKSRFASDIAEIQRTSDKLNLFAGLEDKVSAAGKALVAAKEEAAKLQGQFDAVGRSGNKATDDLVARMKEVATQVSRANTEYNKQVDAISKTQNALARAAVDTKNLTTEQTRLATALRVAQDAAANQSAQQLLGLRTLRDINPEIQKLNAAYNTLSVSGTLSVKELAQAQQLLKDRTAELRGQVTGTAQAAKAGGFDLQQFFTRSLLPALGLTASLATVVAGIKGVISAGNEYQNGLARIGTATRVTQGELATLGKGVRELATEFGFDLKEGLQSVLELLRSGVPKENVLEVLRISAESANAQMISIGTATKVSNLLISAFGVQVGDLAAKMDVLSVSASHGGASFEEWAASGGSLLNIARTAKIGFEDLVGAETLMVNAGVEASSAFTELGRAIIKLQTEPVRQQLRAMQITATDLVGVLTELGRRRVDLDVLLDLGLAGTKAAGGISALTNNIKDLPPLLREFANSVGDAKQKADALFNTPEERQKRFNAAWEETKIAVSESLGPLGKAQQALTDLMNRQSQVLDTMTAQRNEVAAGTRAWYDFLTPINDARTETQKLTDAQKDAAAAQTTYRQNLDFIATATTNAQNRMKGLTGELLANVQALQTAAARNITDINTGAAEAIAALDRRVSATKETATATLAIETKRAADVLEVIKTSEKEITGILDQAIAAREAADRKLQINEAKIAFDSAKQRADALTASLTQYRALYDSLLAQEQNYKAKSDAIQQERLSFNEGIEKKLFDIRLQGLSAFDQYLATVKEVERLAGLAREAGAQDDIKRAKGYIDQALALTDSIKTAVGSTGAILISADQAQQKRIELTKKLAASYNETLTSAGTAAEEGAAQTEDALKDVRAAMVITEVRYNDMKLLLEQGIDIKVAADTTSFNEVRGQLERLTADRTVLIRTQLVSDATAPGVIGSFTGIPGIGPFAKGGYVPNLAQMFANGGGVFREPGWSKVPGSGSGDTVPAMLQSGSYVVKKSASGFYGDALMGALAGRMASGGPVAQRFAVGGGAMNAGAIADRFFGGTGTRARDILGVGDQSPDGIKLHQLKVLAQQEVQSILDRAQGLPRATSGQDVRDYVRNVAALIMGAGVKDYDTAKSLLDMLVVYYNRFSPGIEQSKQWHVALAMGDPAGNATSSKQPGTVGPISPLTPVAKGSKQPLGAWEALQAQPGAWELLQQTPDAWRTLQNWQLGYITGSGSGNSSGLSGGIYGGDWSGITPSPGSGGNFYEGFARGGAVDSVPAWLTPGEWVIPKRVVGMLGGGLLSAVNNMRVSRETLAGLAFNLPKMPRFAQGGPVPGAAIPQRLATGGSVKGWSGPGPTINIYAQRVDEAEVRRSVVPVLDKIMRESR